MAMIAQDKDREKRERVVVSVGGSILLDPDGDIDLAQVKAVAGVLTEASPVYDLGVVVGGGSTARRYISAMAELGADQSSLDYGGIAATRLNASLLISALQLQGVEVNPLPARDQAEAARELGNRPVVVMGGTVPGHTTDAVAAVLCEHLGAGRFVNATSVDGVYDKDPRKHEDAKRFETMTHGELLAIATKGMGAGVNIVVDPLAAIILKRSNITTLVVNGRDLDSLALAISGSCEGCTLIKD